MSVEAAQICVFEPWIVEHESAGVALNQVYAKRSPVPYSFGQEGRDQGAFESTDVTFANHALRNIGHLFFSLSLRTQRDPGEVCLSNIPIGNTCSLRVYRSHFKCSFIPPVEIGGLVGIDTKFFGRPSIDGRVKQNRRLLRMGYTLLAMSRMRQLSLRI